MARKRRSSGMFENIFQAINKSEFLRLTILINVSSAHKEHSKVGLLRGFFPLNPFSKSVHGKKWHKATPSFVPLIRPLDGHAISWATSPFGVGERNLLLNGPLKKRQRKRVAQGHKQYFVLHIPLTVGLGPPHFIILLVWPTGSHMFSNCASHRKKKPVTVFIPQHQSDTI